MDRFGELFLFLNMSGALHPSLGDVREYLHTELGFIIGRCYWQMLSGDQGSTRRPPILVCTGQNHNKGQQHRDGET